MCVWVVKRQKREGVTKETGLIYEMKGWDVTVAKSECPGSRNGACSEKTKGGAEETYKDRKRQKERKRHVTWGIGRHKE